MGANPIPKVEELGEGEMQETSVQLFFRKHNSFFCTLVGQFVIIILSDESSHFAQEELS